MEKFYIKKKNGRYKEIGDQFTGFPAEGIWLVQKKDHSTESRVILQLGELPSAITLAKLEPYRQLIGTIIYKYMKHCNDPFSVEDVATAVFKAIAEDEDKKRLNVERDELTKDFVPQKPIAMVPGTINVF